jgi:nitrite reductase/ring-hydroxylating ferredoxin subunit
LGPSQGERPTDTCRAPDIARPGTIDAGPADEVLTRGRSVITFGDTEVLVFLTRRGTFAVENRCPHTGHRRLADAVVSRSTLECVGHGRRYNLHSGKAHRSATGNGLGLRTFDVTIDRGRIWLSSKQASESRSTNG